MGRLANKVAVIIGATREGNMGQAIAERFLAEGAQVVVSGRGRDGLDAFAARTGATAIPCDISSRTQIEALAGATIERHGRIDIAVNAAAIGFLAKFEEETEAQIDSMLSIIFKGGLFFMQTVLAVHDLEFELDGNATPGDPEPGVVDWTDIFNSSGQPQCFTKGPILASDALALNPNPEIPAHSPPIGL